MVQLGDSNPEAYEVAMGSMLNAMPALTESSKCKDGLGLEERMHFTNFEYSLYILDSFNPLSQNMTLLSFDYIVSYAQTLCHSSFVITYLITISI